MSKRKRRSFGILISFLLCSILAITVSLWQMSFQEDSLLGKLLSASNGCFAAAALWGSLGLLLLVASFDGFRAIQYLGYTFRFKWAKNRGETEDRLDSYYEFTQKRKKENKEKRMVKLFLLPAVLYLAAAVVLTVIFEQMR